MPTSANNFYPRLTPARALNHSQDAHGRESPQAGAIQSQPTEKTPYSKMVIERWMPHAYSKSMGIRRPPRRSHRKPRVPGTGGENQPGFQDQGSGYWDQTPGNEDQDQDTARDRDPGCQDQNADYKQQHMETVPVATPVRDTSGMRLSVNNTRSTD